MAILRILAKRKNQQYFTDFKEVMSEFNRSLSLFVDQDQLRANIISKIKKIILVDNVYIFLINQEENNFIIENRETDVGEFVFHRNDKLIFWMNVNETYLNLKKSSEVLKFLSDREKNFLTRLNIEFAYPLRVMNKTRGLVLLPRKNNNKEYIEEEVELIGNLLDQASFALENASLYKQQKDRLKKMYRTDRLAMMGELAAGAAHEIRNPLTSIRSTIQFLKNDIKDSHKKELAEGLIEEVDRINEIIQGLLSFAKPSELELETVDLNTLLTQCIKLITNTANKKQISINYQFLSDKSHIYADSGQLKQVFLNVLINGIQAFDKSGEIRVIVLNKESSNIYSRGNNSDVFISFKDNGKGIMKEDMEKIFDPFFTTKEDGTGLGLSISYGIINRHGGDIYLDSTPGKGTNVTIKLPT